MKESMADISQGKKFEMDVCPHCGPLEGGLHPLPDCPYREEAEEKIAAPTKIMEAPAISAGRQAIIEEGKPVIVQEEKPLATEIKIPEEKTPEQCPACGHFLPDHEQFCGEKGKKQPVKAEAAAPAEKKEEKEMTPEEEKKFREELIERAKRFEGFAAPTETPGPVEIPKSEAPKGDVFEELFGK